MNLNIKWRPTTFSEFIGNEEVVRDIKYLLKVGDMPHIMLVGPPGVGKTTLELLIASYYLKKRVKISTEAGVSDFFVVNASDQRGIDVVRDVVKLHAKARSRTFDKNGNRLKRVIAMREADKLTEDAQHALRDVVEKYEYNCIFIFTLNHIAGIKEDALISRCYVGFLKKPTKEQSAKLCLKIVNGEGIKLDPALAFDIAEYYKGDLRHMQNDCLEVLRGVEGTVTKKDLWKIYNSEQNKSVARRVFESDDPREEFKKILGTESFDVRNFLEEYYDLLGNNSLTVSKAFAEIDARLRDKCSESLQMSYLFSLLDLVKATDAIKV